MYCPHCHGLVMEPNKTYGYSGKVCYCVWYPRGNMDLGRVQQEISQTTILQEQLNQANARIEYYTQDNKTLFDANEKLKEAANASILEQSKLEARNSYLLHRVQELEAFIRDNITDAIFISKSRLKVKASEILEKI